VIIRKNMTPKQELTILRELKLIYNDTDAILRRYKLRIWIYGILGMIGVPSGIYLSSEGVIQGACDICVGLGGMFGTMAFIYNYAMSNVRVLKAYTRFESDSADARITELE